VAVFNPDVQDLPVPNLEQLARPNYYQPKADESGAIMGEAVGKNIDLGLKGIDTAVKQYIDYKTDAEVSPVRDSFTNALNSYRLAQTGQATATPSVSDTSPSTDTSGNTVNTNATSATPPRSLEQGLNGIATVQGALDSKKISETYYYGQLNSIAKSLRSNFPGWRDYVDARIHEVTGVNPANAYLRSIITDIQTANTNKDKEKTEALSKAYAANAAGAPDGPAAIQAFREGRLSIDGLNLWTNGVNAEKYRNEQAIRKLDVYQKGSTVGKEAAKVAWGQQQADDATRVFNGVMHGTTLKSGQDIAAWIQQIQENPNDPKLGEKALVYEQQVRANAQNFYNMELRKASQRPAPTADNPNPQTGLEQLGGREEFEKSVKANMVQFDQLADALHNKDWGFVGLHMRLNKAAEDSQEYAARNDPTIGDTLSRLKAATKDLPKGLQDTITSAALKGTFKDGVTKWITNGTAKAINPPPATNPWSFDQEIRDGKARGIKDPNAFNALLGNINLLRNPAMTQSQGGLNAMHNLAQGAFGPQNRDMLRNENFNREYWDPSLNGGKGGYVPGQYAVYNRFGQPDITKAMWELGQKGHPQDWTDYRNWMEETGENHLFSKEIQDMRAIAALPQGYHFTYNNTAFPPTLELKQDSPTGQPVPGQKSPGLVDVQQSVDRINMMIRPLAYVEKQSGGNVDAYLLDILQRKGVDVTKFNGVPEDIMTAIRAAQKPPGPKKFEDTLDPFGNTSKDKNQDRVR
jgi:hypothetical protein